MQTLKLTLKSRLPMGELGRHVMSMLSGNVLAQALMAALMPDSTCLTPSSATGVWTAL